MNPGQIIFSKYLEYFNVKLPVLDFGIYLTFDATLSLIKNTLLKII